MRKMLTIVACLTLVFALQAGAGVTTPSTYSPDLTAVDNAKAPDRGVDATDVTLYLEDFEAGQGDWTFVDVTAAGIQWHPDTFNAYTGNSWWCGDPLIGGYDNHWLQYLVSPSLDFSAATNPLLTFKLFYAVEAPGGEPAPYDGWDGCNVWASNDGGTTWTPIMPTFPAYTCTSMYSFGFEWGMGPDIPGWGASSGGWVDAQFDLSALAGQSDVMVRFAFCSDPAWCTIDDPTLLGFYVDDVSIDDGATNLLANDADGVAFPSDFTFDTGGAAGDFWTLTTASQHSGVNSMLCDHAGHYNLSDALVSPWYSIPTGTNVAFSFWLWCNMPDFTGAGGTTLEDYYSVDITTDDVVWTQVFYDYGDITRPGGALVGWDSYDPGDPFNGNITMSLAAYAGQDVKLRFRVITDDNDDGGIGDGLYIDDLEIFTTGLNNDVGALKLNVPYPSSLYFTSIPCSVELHNFGNLDQGLVPAAWRVDYGTPNPLIPWASIPMLSYVTKTWDWTPAGVGSYFMDAYTFMGSDEDLSNDTSLAGVIDVTAADVWEFGYDGREWTYEPSFYYFNFEAGEGAYVRYTPADDGITDPVQITDLKALFNDAGTINIHLYNAGTSTTPGAQIAAFNYNVTQIQPLWETIDISAANITGEFWVWYEVLVPAGTPHIMGWDENKFGVDHFFDDFGGGFGPSDYAYFSHAIGGPGTTPNFDVSLTYVSGSPVPAGGGPLTFDVYILNASGVAQDYDAWLATEYEGGAPTTLVLRSFVNFQAGWAINRPGMFFPVPGAWAGGNYTLNARVGYEPATVWNEDGFPFVKSGASYAGFQPYPVAGAPNPFDVIQTNVIDLPTEYALQGAYPNPFNPTTSINFDLPEAGQVKLAVYDLQGRLVQTLVDGQRNAGVHQVTFDASSLASGVYIYTLSAGDYYANGKVVLMK